ncbi:MAG: hypothetical protein LAO04_00810 [Acidobacteriia bacterium]|nr:hypothetical protein [Terriglobia bacterium]
MSHARVPDSARDFATNLPANIKFLASQIARKPAAFTPEWASTADEAFSLYTRTSTVNLVLALNEVIADFDWPFPGYANLRRELGGNEHSALKSRLRFLINIFSRDCSLFSSAVIAGVTSGKEKARALFDARMVRLFRRNAKSVFRYWHDHPLLVSRRVVVGDLKRCYEKELWAACVPTVLPLLDLVMRAYFGSDKLRLSIQTLRDAFKAAKILPKDLKPGRAVWNGRREPTSGNALVATLEEDLRLPGVFLSSFVEFANTYYSWYTVTSTSPSSTLNRHAVMHCASEYWNEINATKSFTFFDLTLRIEKPLRILIHGPAIGASPTPVV